MPAGLHNNSKKPKHSLKCDDVLVFKYIDSKESVLHFFVGRKYGNAIKRNLFKRRSRFLYSKLLNKLDGLALGLSIYPLKKNISFTELQASFILLENKLGKFYA
tara:strand:+ start:823 stop:1134 length:312 start_codon:yes stop_codon:yes gene_type:complete